MKSKYPDLHKTILPDERCQIRACPLTRDWENINHAIKPGCIKWKIIEQNNQSPLTTNMELIPIQIVQIVRTTRRTFLRGKK